MTELLPSWIVLASALGSLAFLIATGPDKKPATLVNRLLMAALCFIGGFLLSAMYSRVAGEATAPMIVAILVMIGTAGSTAIFRTIEKKHKTGDREN